MKRSVPWAQLVAISAFSVAGTLASPAHAQVSHDYHPGDAPKGCIAEMAADNLNPNLIKTSGGSIFNNTGHDVKILCPIPKTTSGPGITTDDLQAIIVPTLGSDTLFIECKSRVWRSSVSGNQDSNIKINVSGAATGGSTMWLAPTFFNVSGFWDGESGAWYYADMFCALPDQTGIDTYTVQENGSDQPGRIYPGVYCAPDASNTVPWHYVGADAWPSQGGWVHGQAGFQPGTMIDGTKFIFNCPLANSVNATFRVGPTVNNGITTLRCKLDSTNLSSGGWPTGAQTGDFPFATLPAGGQPAITTPSTGSHSLSCGVDGTTGDGKVVSYRTVPQ